MEFTAKTVSHKIKKKTIKIKHRILLKYTIEIYPRIADYTCNTHVRASIHFLHRELFSAEMNLVSSSLLS